MLGGRGGEGRARGCVEEEGRKQQEVKVEQAVSNDGNMAISYNNMGVLLSKMAKHDEALHYYQIAHSIDPEYKVRRGGGRRGAVCVGGKEEEEEEKEGKGGGGRDRREEGGT